MIRTKRTLLILALITACKEAALTALGVSLRPKFPSPSHGSRAIKEPGSEATYGSYESSSSEEPRSGVSYAEYLPGKAQRKGADAKLHRILTAGEDSLELGRVFEVRFANRQIDYSMTTDEVGRACSSDTQLFIFVPSRPTSFDVREQIRRTWASKMPSSVVLKFVVGQPAEEDVYELLLGELEERGDLIVNSLADSYENLYLKIYSALQWQQAYCPQATYLLKTDDDTVVDVERLLHWIEKRFSSVVVTYPAAEFGIVWSGARPNRNETSKWHVPESIYEERFYPNYLNGPTYLLTAEAAKRILEAARETKAFSVEDVLYTGVLATKAAVAKRDASAHFHYTSEIKPVEACKEGVPLVTAVYPVPSASQFRSVYKALRLAKC